MTDHFVVCPHCNADARNGATFTMTDDIDEAISYSRGGTMEAREQFTCVACGGRFAAWTYIVGKPRSKKWNLVLEDGSSPPEPHAPIIAAGWRAATAFERS